LQTFYTDVNILNYVTFKSKCLCVCVIIVPWNNVIVILTNVDDSATENHILKLLID